MKASVLARILGPMAAVAFAASAHAVCFYPHSLLSGYQIPLRSELQSTPIIIVGKVSKIRSVHGDPGYPNYATAYFYSVNVLRVLKGKVPKQFTLYATNDSGGYRMSLRETDLLFITRVDGRLTADVCGNSTELPKGRYVLSEVLQLLGAGKAVP